jgi:hypothetical protein
LKRIRQPKHGEQTAGAERKNAKDQKKNGHFLGYLKSASSFCALAILLSSSAFASGSAAILKFTAWRGLFWKVPSLDE